MTPFSTPKIRDRLKTVGLFARPDREIALSAAVSAERFLLERGIDVQLDKDIADYKGDRKKGVDIQDMKVDLLIVIGGDGTILKASMDSLYEIPILGVKVGTGGFLTEVPPREIPSALQRCLDGDYSIEACLKIESSLNGKALPNALNEVLMVSSEPSKMMNSTVHHKQFEIELRSDGLIISTPTGSTAYSLSAGGPILSTNLDCLVVTPLCSLSNIRPIVFSSEDTLGIELRGKSPVVKVVVDGLNSSPMNLGDELTIGRSQRRALFIRFEEDFFTKRIKRRLCS